LANEEYVRGARVLKEKVLRYQPGFVAFIGLGAYRAAFARPNAVVGRQQDRLGNTSIWVLPSTSGLNANYRPEDLARLFGELREAID
jgi:double-stranded uracil-DNA glycosylase